MRGYGRRAKAGQHKTAALGNRAHCGPRLPPARPPHIPPACPAPPSPAAPRHHPAPAKPPARTGAPTPIGKFGDWQAATVEQAGQLACYAFTRPIRSTPRLPGRGEVVLTVTERGANRDVVAITAG